MTVRKMSPYWNYSITCICDLSNGINNTPQIATYSIIIYYNSPLEDIP